MVPNEVALTLESKSYLKQWAKCILAESSL